MIPILHTPTDLDSRRHMPGTRVYGDLCEPPYLTPPHPTMGDRESKVYTTREEVSLLLTIFYFPIRPPK